MITLDIINNTEYIVVRKDIENVIEKVLREKGETGPVEVSLSLVDEGEMKTLHKKYMETEEATDVLSFPLDETVFPDGLKRLGDIVICTEVAIRQAGVEGISTDQEIKFLVDHGMRHLLGEHHE